LAGRFLKLLCLRLALPAALGVFAFSSTYAAVTSPASLDPEIAAEKFKIEGSFVSGAGVRTHYVKEGDGDTTVVLIHGFGGSTYSWRLNIAELSRKYTVIAVDMRGFGYTSRDPASEYSPRAYATHVATFLDQLKVRRPILVGHSLGGEVAMRIALQRPDDVAGLVLLDSAGLPDRPRPAAPPIPPPFRQALLRLLTSPRAVRAGLELAFYDKSFVDKEMVDAYRRPLQVEGAEEMLWRMTRTRTPSLNRSEIARIKVPTIVVWGKQDRLIPLQEGVELAATIPGARLVVIDRVGHMPQEERPDVVNALIDELASSAGKPLPGQPRPTLPPPRAGTGPIPGVSPTPSPTATGRTPAPGPTGGLLSR
jgi:pimeloyl-ACP methyl ester carboxylesterase